MRKIGSLWIMATLLAAFLAVCSNAPTTAAEANAAENDNVDAEEACSSCCDAAKNEKEEGFVPLFNGKNLDGWMGSTSGYVVEDGRLICKAKGGGKLLTEKQYADFALRFEFKLEPGGNNGVAIRTPAEGNPARVGMEIQILDNHAEKYKNLKPYQFHGSVYFHVPAKRGHLKPAGQWNSEEIRCEGSRVKVMLNGAVIVDADLMTVKDEPIIKPAKGHIGFMGHGSRVEFRNIRLKEL